MTDLEDRASADTGTAEPTTAETAAPTTYEHIRVARAGDTVTITMARPQRRNSLSEAHLRELLAAFAAVAQTDALAVVLAGDGPVWSSGHDFADVAPRDFAATRELLTLCTSLMQLIQSVPQVVVARIHALATAGGCQLAASCDLAVAAESAGFALPGGKAGWFCHTPAVPVARAIGRKRLMEMALSGDVVSATTAAEWGLVNYTVPDDQLDEAVADLVRRTTRGSAENKALGKQTLYAQLDRPERDAYSITLDVMAAASQTAYAKEGSAAFLEKRAPVWPS